MTMKTNREDILDLKALAFDYFEVRTHLHRLQFLNTLAEHEAKKKVVNFTKVKFLTTTVRDQLNEYINA